jgi:hypothetical protein
MRATCARPDSRYPPALRSLVRLLRLAALTVSVGAASACAEGGSGVDDEDTLDGGRPDRLAPPESDAGPVTPGQTDGGVEASAPDAGDACADALKALAFDFESGPQGWTHGISDGVAPPPAWPYDPWVQGTASVGPACASGKCFGTELTKNYAQCQRGYLLSPKLDLSKCAGRDVSVTFKHAYTFWSGLYNGTVYYDGGVVEASGNDGAAFSGLTGTTPGTVKINPNRGASYTCHESTNFGVNNKAGFTGAKATETVSLTLPASALTASARIRFSFASGVSSSTTNADTSRSGTDAGWRIDEIGFTAR